MVRRQQIFRSRASREPLVQPLAELSALRSPMPPPVLVDFLVPCIHEAGALSVGRSGSGLEKLLKLSYIYWYRSLNCTLLWFEIIYVPISYSARLTAISRAFVSVFLLGIYPDGPARSRHGEVVQNRHNPKRQPRPSPCPKKDYRHAQNS